MKKHVAIAQFAVACLIMASGCTRITAHNLDRSSGERSGIPFYLPKPYLIIAKNVRYIPAPTIGLTQTAPIPGSFDQGLAELNIQGQVNQSRTVTATRTVTETVSSDRGGATPAATPAPTAAPAALVSNAGSEASGKDSQLQGGEEKRKDDEEGGGQKSPYYGDQVTTADNPGVVPAASISDGLIPHTFYTYQIVYLPDLTQKYGLKVYSGPGEMRSTMNLVNGWMHTGTGPLYMRDSTTAASIASVGMAAGNIVDSVAGLGATKVQRAAGNNAPDLLKLIQGAPGFRAEGPPAARIGHKPLNDYAVLYIYEPVLSKDAHGNKVITWRLVGNKPIKFDREYTDIE